MLVLTVLGLLFTGQVSPVMAAVDGTSIDRCDFDPRFGGSVANLVELDVEAGVNVGHLVVAPNGQSYASFWELNFDGGPTLSVIRFGPDGRLDRTFGVDGFARLPASGSVRALGLSDGGLVVVVAGFGGQDPVVVMRLTGAGQLDPNFGDAGKTVLAEPGSVHEVAAIVGEASTMVFVGDHASSLIQFEVDPRGRQREVTRVDLQVGEVQAAYGDVAGQMLVLTRGLTEERFPEPVALGGGVTVLEIEGRIVGSGVDRIWMWSHSDEAERPSGIITSIDFQGIYQQPLALNLRHSFDSGPSQVEAVMTLPSGEILVVGIERHGEFDPVGAIYRFVGREAIETGRFSKVDIDLNKEGAFPPQTELIRDLNGGVRVFSGAWSTSSGGASQARLLPHPVTIPEAGAMVDQVERLYHAAFNRAPDAPGLGYWLDQRATGLPISSVANLFVQSAEFRATYASPDEAEFVKILYRNVLNRHSDSEGLAYWTGRLRSGGLTRPQVLLAFSDSPELVESSSSLAPNESSWTGLSRLYETAFDRPVDVEGFCYFVAEIQDGQPLSWVAQQMLASAEFTARHDGTDAGVVIAMYQGAFDRSPGEGELNYWISQLSSGTPRTALLLHIANSPEALRRLGY